MSGGILNTMKNLLWLLFVIVGLSLTSCVDIFDEIILHADGSGTYKYTINMSASKVKINSILALDSIDGRRVPKLPEIKERISKYKEKLEAKDGISNVKVDANYDEFIFKISCDFKSVTDLQEAIKELIREESKDKNDPLLNETWLSWDGKKLERSIPNIQSPIAKINGEDQEALKTGKYMCVSRFDVPVVKTQNPSAVISPSKTAVMVKASTYQVANSPSILKNTIETE